MMWISRSADTCDWRKTTGQGAAHAVCELLQEMSGIRDTGFTQVTREACEACCRNFPPSVAEPNATLVSLLYQTAENVRAAGGIPGCDVNRAARLREAALKLIPLSLPHEDDAVIPQAMFQADDHDEWPPVEQILPIPTARSSDRVKSWAVGVTTAPRRLQTLEICLNSLTRAGWSQDIRLFVDNNGSVPPAFVGLPTTRRDSRVGAWPNFYLGLLELYQRNPAADAFMMVQDDVVFYEHPKLRDYLELALWPGPRPGLVSLFCSQLYAQSRPGWYPYNGQWQWGAQVFVFSNAVLREFLASTEVVAHRTNSTNGLALIDHLVGKWSVAHNVPVFFPTPSLSQHIGHSSTLWRAARITGGRRASPFAGDMVDRIDRGDGSAESVAVRTEGPGQSDGKRRDDSTESIVDCLGRARVFYPAEPLRAENCVVTIASDGFDHWLDDMLGSLRANGGCQDTLVAVIVPEGSQRCLEVANKYGVRVIRCRGLSRLNATFKSVMYSITHVIDAQRFICLDADMIVLDDLSSLFHAIDALPRNSILACREGNDGRHPDLQQAFESVYFGRRGDLQSKLLADEREHRYPLVVNDGLFAGSREALSALDAEIRKLSAARNWIDERNDVRWRNQFVFNLMLARLDCGVELDPRYNLQLWHQDVEVFDRSGRMCATWNSRPVHVLHFCSLGREPGGRDKYPEWRGRFAQVREPLAGQGCGDGYAKLVECLRRWLGQRGLPALRWSFYGTGDAVSATVRDPSVFPAFACLHYLIRSGGCRRVLETGTGNGVSTAVLASAVAHHPDGSVVTIDTADSREREELWYGLPEAMRGRIDPLLGDSLQAMARLLSENRRFDAALLDSDHTSEHVWKEFEYATRLVAPGGLILIHDVLLKTGTVEQALRKIEKHGFGVTRIWTAEDVQPDDNRLGLAIIENRPRS